MLHERVDEGAGETRGDLHIARSLRLVSYAFGLTGMADVVEFHRDSEGVGLSGRDGRWSPYPVEYKWGRSKLEASISNDHRLTSSHLSLRPRDHRSRIHHPVLRNL